MKDILYFDELDSTNNYLKREHENTPERTAVVAARQTAGRGRLGRSFCSESGGLYLSYLMKPKTLPEALLSITGMSAVAASRAINAVCGIIPDIKWTNDLYIGPAKICGILTEAVSSGGSISCIMIGIGINVNTPDDAFPSSLIGKATSIASFKGSSTDIRALAEKLKSELDIMYTDLISGNTSPYVGEFRKRCITVGKTVTVTLEGESTTAEAIGIDDDFALIVSMPDGSEKIIRSGEATLDRSVK